MWRLVALVLGLVGSPALAVETLRIAMGDSAAPVAIHGKGLSAGADSETGVFRALEKDSVKVRNAGGKIEIDGVLFPGESVRLRAASPTGTGSTGTGTGEGSLAAMGVNVRGDIVVQPKGQGVLLINVLPLEDYLAAVLGSEMPRSFPLEALKAQAVAARTYALHKKIADFDGKYHLGSSVLHQVYGGLEREDAKTREAVRQTWGQVLTHDFAPIEAYFHASCGGKTENGADALSRPLPYLRAVSCPCESLPASRWKAVLRADELHRALGRGAGADGIRVLSRSETGRARKVSLGTSSLDAVTFRRKLGYTRVKSLNFEIEKESGGRLLLTGRGNGHGAGLCQWGAKVLAEQGWDYRRIVAHYYPGTELQLLY